MSSLIERDLALFTIVALAAGTLIVSSLFLPWFSVTDEESGEITEFNAFQIGNATIESLNLAFVATAFNFLFLFGFLLISGTFLRLIEMEIGLHLVYAGALLSLLFTVITLIVSSFLTFTRPSLCQWVCFCSSIAALISPRLSVKN